METNLKKVNQILKEIADNHANIYDYGLGDVWEINAKDRNFTLLWVDLQPSTINPKTVVLNMNLYCMDLVTNGESNELNVQSDTLQILEDVIILLKRKYELINENYSAQATPFTENFGADVSGWFIPIQIETPSIYGKCDVPNKEINL